MSDVLRKIKRLILKGRYKFSEKARLEMEADGITEFNIVESILSAVTIYKTLRDEQTNFLPDMRQ